MQNNSSSKDKITTFTGKDSTNETKLSLFCLRALETFWLLVVLGVPILILPDINLSTAKFYFFGVAVISMLFFWLVRLVELQKFEFKLNIFSGLVFLFFTSVVFATIFSSAPDLSFWGSERRQGLLSFILYILFFVMVASSLKSPKQIGRIITALILASFISSIVAVLQYFDIFIFKNSAEMLLENGHYRARGTGGNPMFFAGWLAIIIPLVIYRIFTCYRRNGVRKITLYFYIITAILTMAALFFTFTRGAILAFFATILSAMIIIGVKKKIKWLWISAVIIFMIALFSVISVNLPSNPLKIPKNNIVVSRFSNLMGTEGYSSFYTRIMIWKMMFRPIKDHFWLGMGPDAFGPFSESQEYFNKEVIKLEATYYEQRIDQAHNVILDSMLAVGFFGTIFFLGIIIYMLTVLFKMIFYSDNKNWYFPLVLFLALVAFLVQGISSFSEILIYIMLFTLFAVFYFFEKKDVSQSNADLQFARQEKPAFSRNPLWIYLPLVPVLGLMMYYFINPPLAMELDFNRAQKLLYKPDTKAEGEELMIKTWEKFPRPQRITNAVMEILINLKESRKFESIEKKIIEFHEKMPEEIAFPLTLANVYVRWAELSGDETKIDNAKSTLSEAIDYYGNKYSLYSAYILLLADSCEFDKTDDAIKKALDFSSYAKGKYYIFASRGAINCKNYDKAIEYLNKINDASEKEAYQEKYFQLGNIYAEMGDSKMADENWEKFLENAQLDARILENLYLKYLTEKDYDRALLFAEKLKKIDAQKGEELINQINDIKKLNE